MDLPSGALSVHAEDVEYTYREGGRVLHGISLDIQAGEHVAIVGETGCGKTTFVKLVSRLADPKAGRIEVGGIDLREIAASSRHRSLRMVPQDGFLFDLSVLENVRAGSPNAGCFSVRRRTSSGRSALSSRIIPDFDRGRSCGPGCSCSGARSARASCARSR